jgi:hypothetical protein
MAVKDEEILAKLLAYDRYIGLKQLRDALNVSNSINAADFIEFAERIQNLEYDKLIAYEGISDIRPSGQQNREWINNNLGSIKVRITANGKMWLKEYKK